MSTNFNLERKAQILDAAAEIFAELEFYGASMRVIAKRAGVSQSLIHYHYETKEQLFEAVFDRHVTSVNKRRAELLRRFIEVGPGDEERTLEELVEILIRPWVEVTQSPDRATREFARFIIRSAYHQDEWSKKVAVEQYSEMRRLGVEAFIKVAPEFHEDDAFRAYLFTLSMFFMPLSAPERLKSLAARDIDMVHSTSLLHYGVRFAVAGITAMREEAERKGMPAKRKSRHGQAAASRSLRNVTKVAGESQSAQPANLVNAASLSASSSR